MDGSRIARSKLNEFARVCYYNICSAVDDENQTESINYPGVDEGRRIIIISVKEKSTRTQTDRQGSRRNKKGRGNFVNQTKSPNILRFRGINIWPMRQLFDPENPKYILMSKGNSYLYQNKLIIGDICN